MFKIRAFLLIGALACVPAYAQSQSPIPEARVPGFGGTASQTGAGPASSGSNVGSNVGAGSSASPVGNDVTPPGNAPDIAEAPRTRPLFGLSRDLP